MSFTNNNPSAENVNTGSTEVCLNFLHVIENLFMGTLPSYEAALEPFSPEEDMKNAGAQLKILVDTLPQKAQDSMITLTVHGSLHSHCPVEDFPHPSAAVSTPFGDPFLIQRGESQWPDQLLAHTPFHGQTAGLEALPGPCSNLTYGGRQGEVRQGGS
ncbi:hypothetical protein EI555_004214 [Monodon monoceros]|uniref:Uteroglobin n=1 Tax=Monodon monoceros TaxID=40151 RepID=A0A4U1FMA2_MONMO|nr:hypothetical protein EI555_004214 [Monodon monoceros]